MSMWEIEALVEASVLAYSRSGRPVGERRSRYWNLFEYEARYDTGFTRFRTMGELRWSWRWLLLAAARG